MKYSVIALAGAALLVGALFMPLFYFNLYREINFTFIQFLGFLNNELTSSFWIGFMFSARGVLFDLAIIAFISAIPFGIAGIFSKKPKIIASGLAILSFFSMLFELIILSFTLYIAHNLAEGYLPPVLITSTSLISPPVSSLSLFSIFALFAGILFYVAFYIEKNKGIDQGILLEIRQRV